jgi:hypothetical protein
LERGDASKRGWLANRKQGNPTNKVGAGDSAEAHKALNVRLRGITPGAKPQEIITKKGAAMRTVINNKVYDTNTAQFLGAYEHNGITECLYRKRTGEYFLHMTDKQPRKDKAGWRDGNKIAPYDYETARTWAELSLSKSLFERLFSGAGEDKQVMLGARVKDSTVAKLEQLQSETGKTIGELIDLAVNSYVASI